MSSAHRSIVAGCSWIGSGRSAADPATATLRSWRTRVTDAWELDDLEAAQRAKGRPYHEFLSVPDLSGGLYVLEAGATDMQSPHTEDELYLVMSGRARMTVGDEVRDVHAGTVVFVAAGVSHRFHDIEERLVLVVAFGPAEDTRA